jgi:hypothetical protein
LPLARSLERALEVHVLSVATYLLLASIAFFLPAVTGLLGAVWAGVESRPAQAICALAAPCVIAYLASGFYLISPTAGLVAAIAIYIVTLTAGMGVARRCGLPQVRAALRFWFGPALMAPAAAAVSLGIGFLHGGLGVPLRLAQSRYIQHPANDNVLPLRFAQQLEAALRPVPHHVSAAWLSSDRPPLETSVYVFLHALLPLGSATPPLLYEVIGVLLQSLWLPALWCLLHAVRLPRPIIAAGLTSISVCCFVLFNSFYVWPKLFPAAFLVLLAAVLLTTEWESLRAKVSGGVACGLAAGLAMLGHEGSALALVGLAVVVLVSRRRWPRWRCALPGLGVLIALLLPWTLYQSFYDPPGTDLMKLQLAGVFPPSSLSLPIAIVRAYEKVTPEHFWQHKWSNLTLPFSSEPQEMSSLLSLTENLFASSGKASNARSAAIKELNRLAFLYLLPSLGLMAFSPIAYLLAVWLRRQRGPDLSLAGQICGFLAVTILIWAFVLFDPGFTNNYQGSYAFELLAFAAALISVWRLSRVLAYLLVGLQFVIGIVTSATVDLVYPNTPRLTATTPADLLVIVVGLVAIAVLPLLSGRDARPGHVVAPRAGVHGP